MGVVEEWGDRREVSSYFLPNFSSPTVVLSPHSTNMPSNQSSHPPPPTFLPIWTWRDWLMVVVVEWGDKTEVGGSKSGGRWEEEDAGLEFRLYYF